MSSNGTDKEQSAYRFTAHLGAAVWTCRSAKPLSGVTSGAPTFPGRRFSSAKPLSGVTSGAPTSPGRRFINRRGDIHVARVAGGNMRDRGGLVPSIVCGRAKPLSGVTSGAPTSPGRRFVNRRGDIHVARMAGGNMQDRGSLFHQSVGGRIKPLAGVSNRWRASQVAPQRFPGGGLSIVGATFMSPGWQAGICGNDGLKQVPEADRNTSSSNNPIKTKNHADSKIIKRCGNAGFRLWRVSGDSRGV